MQNKIGIWIGIISSLATIALAILTYSLNSQKQDVELKLEEAKSQLDEKKYLIELSKEKTERCEFVNKLLPEVLKKDKLNVTLATNLIKLTLTEREADSLFAGFASSNDPKVKEIGTNEILSIKKQAETASALEKKGFDALVSGRYTDAVEAFESADRTYPTFHQVYEISGLLRKYKNQLNNETIKKQVFKKIVSDYGWKAPQEYLDKLTELSR